MITIKLFPLTGSFAENKDVAKAIRLNKILPALKKRQAIVLDFENVTGVTQSFIHALISDVLRKHGSEILDTISFKSCTETVQKIITIVIDYMQESDF